MIVVAGRHVPLDLTLLSALHCQSPVDQRPHFNVHGRHSRELFLSLKGRGDVGIFTLLVAVMAGHSSRAQKTMLKL